MPVIATNLTTNPSFEAASGTVETRRNYNLNPRMDNSVTGWSVALGATQTAAVGGTVINFPSGLASGAFFFQTAEIATGIGEYWGGSIQVEIPVGFPTLTLIMRTFAYGSNVAIAETTVSIATGTTVTINTGAGLTPAATTGVRTILYPSVAIPTGARMIVRNALVEKSPFIGTYFDGSTAAAGDFVYAWTSTPNNSASAQQAPGVASPVTGNPLGTDGTALIIQSGEWFSRGSKSMRLIPQSVGNGSYVYWNVGATSFLTAGNYYTAIIKTYRNGSGTGTPNAMANTFRYTVNAVATASSTRPNEAGVFEHRITFQHAASGTRLILLYNGFAAGNGDLWADEITIVQVASLADAYTGPSFDGSLPTDPAYMYAWTGAADASTSTLSTYTSMWNDYPGKTWFGNEQRFQAVPTPGTGFQSNHVGYGEQMQYQNGRKGVVRSMQTHKEYTADFPVQEAAGLTGLDVYQKYSTGFYGDLDSYPLFFADKMHYDQNVMPEGWASPGLYRRGWAAIVEDRYRTYDNYVLNPSLELDDVGYLDIDGTGGVAAGARTNATAYTGSWSYGVTWSTGTSAVSGGISYTGFGTGVSPITFGWGGMVHVWSSKIQRVQAFIRFLDGSSTVLGSASSTQTVLTATTWTEIKIPLTAAPVGTVNARIEIIAVAGTSGTNWAPGDILRADGLMLYSGVSGGGEPQNYFDGDSPGARWASTPHASRSELLVTRNIPTIVNTPANSYNLPPVGATWNVTSAANAYPTVDNQFGEIPYALIPIPPGYTLHIGWSGSATGTAQLVVEAFNSPGTSVAIAAMTPLSASGAQRMNTTVSSAVAQYAKVYIRRTNADASMITLYSIMAQLWPAYITPNLNGNHIEGKGHRGLKFTDTPTVESYVIVDPSRNVPVHYKGMSTTLIEAQDKG